MAIILVTCIVVAQDTEKKEVLKTSDKETNKEKLTPEKIAAKLRFMPDILYVYNEPTKIKPLDSLEQRNKKNTKER